MGNKIKELIDKYGVEALRSAREAGLGEYMSAKADSVRNAALDKSLSRTRTRDVIVGADSPLEIAADYRATADDLQGIINPRPEMNSAIFDPMGVSTFISDPSSRELSSIEHYLHFLANLEQYRSPEYDAVPFTPFDESMRVAAENERDNHMIQSDINYVNGMAEYYEDLAKTVSSIPKYGETCLSTATDNYGPGHFEAYNPTFAANPERYGFMKIPIKDILPGDIVQDRGEAGGKEPHHALIFNRFDENNNPRFNYSRGTPRTPTDSDTSKYLEFDSRYIHSKPFDDDNYFAYRFVGTEADRQKWEQEYNNGLLYNYKSGGRIHIKPENRGKFTALKERTGHSASWFKAHGTPAQKKMATFALNARKWKHADGGFLHTFEDGGDKPKLKRVDIQEWFDTEGNRGRAVNVPAMEQMQDSLIARGWGLPQRLAVLATAAQEMDKNGAASRGVGGNGYLGYSASRMPVTYLDDTPKGRGEQIHFLLDDLTSLHSDNWLDGGTGGPRIMSGKDGYDQFWGSNNVYNATVLLNKSNIRPAGREDSWKNRANVAKSMQKHLKKEGGLIEKYGVDAIKKALAKK